LTFCNRIWYSIKEYCNRIYEGHLENFNLDCYEPMKTALNELDFIVEFVEKQAQKTVITVSHCEKGDKSPVSAVADYKR